MKTHFKPMLAHKFDNKRVDWSQPVYIQPKLDGIRCVMKADGCYSRNGKKFMNVQHLYTKTIKELFKVNPLLVLDGELYNHDFKDNFEQIISMVRKTKPTDEARAESAENVQFHCYDIVDTTKTFKERNNFILQNVPRNHCIHHVDTTQIHSQEVAKDHHDINLSLGYEGSIIRTNDVYKCGRSWNLRKFKDFHDTEATIVGFVEGKGKRKGTIGKFIAEDKDGVMFGMPVMDKFKYLQDNFKAMQGWIGKTATFTYFEKTKAGSYRHPLFKTIRDYE